MATFFRATVMLSVLVGIPAAWVYYGPLPTQAQRKVDELIERGKLAVGWAATEPRQERAAFDPSSEGFLSADSLAEAPAFQADAARLEPAAPATREEPETNVDAQAEALLAELRELGAAEYALESWGSAGELYRFRCEMPLAATAASSQEFAATRQFEAVAAAPEESIAQVVAEVSSWRSRR